MSYRKSYSKSLRPNTTEINMASYNVCHNSWNTFAALWMIVCVARFTCLKYYHAKRDKMLYTISGCISGVMAWTAPLYNTPSSHRDVNTQTQLVIRVSVLALHWPLEQVIWPKKFDKHGIKASIIALITIAHNIHLSKLVKILIFLTPWFQTLALTLLVM